MNTTTSVSTSARVLIGKVMIIGCLLMLVLSSHVMPAHAVDISRIDVEDISDAKNGALALARFGSRNLIGAYQTRYNSLRLVNLSVSRTGNFSILDTARAGDITDVDLVDMSQGTTKRFVSATSGDVHKVIVWDVDDAGEISRLGDSERQAGGSSLSKIAKLSDNLVVTAVKTDRKYLKLITWKISEDGDRVDRVGDSAIQAGAVREIAFVQLTPNWVVTAIQTQEKKLMLISWKITENGRVIRRKGNIKLGKASNLSIVKLTPLRVLVAMENGSGRLQLTSFDVNTDEDGFITRKVSAYAGKVQGTDMVVSKQYGSTPEVVTAVIEDDHFDQRKLIAWQVPAEGNAPIKRGGESWVDGYTLDIKISRASGYLFTLRLHDANPFPAFSDDKVEASTLSN